MKPSNVIILMLIVAMVVAYLSNNIYLTLALGLVLIVGLAAKLLRSGVRPPGDS